jgi:hypothetical protein
MEGTCPQEVDVGETGRVSAVDGRDGAFFGRGMITGWSEGSTELRSGDLNGGGGDDDDDDDDGPAEGTGGTWGMGGTIGIAGVS